jgi:hypothetical protein
VKGLGCWWLVVLGEEAVDGCLKVEERVEAACLRRRFDSLAKKPSTALSQEQAPSGHD